MKNKRRGLSGIYLFDKFENEEKRKPTVFEDCQESTQNKYLNSLEKPELIILAKKLANTIRELGDTLDIMVNNEN